MKPNPKLSQLGFMDIYVNVDGDLPSYIRPFVLDRTTPPLVILPSYMDEEIAIIKNAIKAKLPRPYFGIVHDGLRFRVSARGTSKGPMWASLRRIREDVPALDELRIPKLVQQKLKFYAKNSGLICFTGATGQGKSTSAVGILGYYLRNHGDVCVTIEDPVEYDLQKQEWNRRGACFQFEVNEDHEWSSLLSMALRWHPRYIYLGELRTPEAAAQALRAATSGHLVLTTLHSGSLQEALQSLRQLVQPVAGERTDSLLAEAFLCVVNQKLTPFGPDMQILYAEGKGSGDPIRALIREGKIEQLSTHINKQNRDHAQDPGRILTG